MTYQQALAYAQATQQWTPQQAAAWQAQQTGQWQQFPAPQQPLPIADAPPPALPQRSPVAAFFGFIYKAVVSVLVFVIVLVLGAFILDAVTGGSLSR